MTKGGVSLHRVDDYCSAADGTVSEADFSAALLREQYRSLARLGPYVHGVVILATLAMFAGAAPTGSRFDGILLPAALIGVSVFRLVSWFKARANVEHETLDVIRRRVRAASVLGPTLTVAFTFVTAISTWRDGVVEFALALIAVWVVAAVCAICLNRIWRARRASSSSRRPRRLSSHSWPEGPS
jgi:predicted signal transduction protein with EAL and GGDEF domain